MEGRFIIEISPKISGCVVCWMTTKKPDKTPLFVRVCTPVMHESGHVSIPIPVFLVQPFLVELIGVKFPDETYQSQFPEIILLLIG